MDKPAAEKKPKFYFQVVDRVSTYVTHAATDPEDRWDRDSTTQSHDIRGITLVGRGGNCINFKPEPDKAYYLVTVNYDTGDSFGRDEGRLEVVELFQNLDKAEALVGKIESSKKDHWEDGFGELKYLLDDGTEASCYTGTWTGYFERFNSADVTLVRLI